MREVRMYLLPSPRLPAAALPVRLKNESREGHVFRVVSDAIPYFKPTYFQMSSAAADDRQGLQHIYGTVIQKWQKLLHTSRYFSMPINALPPSNFNQKDHPFSTAEGNLLLRTSPRTGRRARTKR